MSRWLPTERCKRSAATLSGEKRALQLIICSCWLIPICLRLSSAVSEILCQYTKKGLQALSMAPTLRAHTSLFQDLVTLEFERS